MSERPAAAASPGQHAPNILARVSAFKPAAGGPADTPALLESCLAVERRAAQTLKWAEQTNLSLLTIALDHLTLGRAALYRAILEKSEVRSAKSEVDQAVASLRRSGAQHHLPRGLLTRAWLRFLSDDADGAQADLNEAWEIAERGSIRLHMADIHLHRARLLGMSKCEWRLPNDELADAREELRKARALIESCGYHRRDQELDDAEKAMFL